MLYQVENSESKEQNASYKCDPHAHRKVNRALVQLCHGDRKHEDDEHEETRKALGDGDCEIVGVVEITGY